MSHKRKYNDVETIDLTQSSPPAPSQRARLTEPDWTQRDTWLDDNDEAGIADDIVVISQGNDGNESVLSYQLYGVLDTKIVGVQYYSGYASVGEYVLVRRQPQNQYDRNAIAIENVQRAQIGHIPRTVASKLAKYIDNNSLLVEGSLAGNMGTYDCPLELKLFGSNDPVERANLRSQMKSDRLPCQVIDQKEKEAKGRKREELKKHAAAKKSGKGGGLIGGKYGGQQFDAGSGNWAGTSSQGDGLADVQNLDEIIETAQMFNPRDLGKVAEKFGLDEEALANLPMADFPKKLVTKLLPYQRQGLHWLLEKETPQLPPQGSDDVVQLWKRSKRHTDVFTNVATNFSLKGTKPHLASGGILSDDMGMGKTLEMIALMVSDEQKSKTLKSTLIIAPVGVMSNWKTQIAQHVDTRYALNVLVHHGASKKAVLKPAEIAEYDVVITSYATLATDYFPRGVNNSHSESRSHGLFSVNWRRVILDEGHTIRNPQTKAALAATNLSAQSKWVLTGTPIINNLKDLYSLVRFIGLSGGLERLEIFNSILARPVKAGDVDASLLLQTLMAAICLRRKKEMKFVDLRLPPLTEYVHRIDFYPSEREKYDALQAEAKGLLHNVTRDDKTPDTYRHLLEVLLRLRQVCNHWSLCGERVTSILSLLSSQKMVELTPPNKKALQDLLQLSIDTRDDCPICLSPLHNPVITPCAHSFGYECIERCIETQHRCPMCRAEPLSLDTLVRPALELGESTTLPPPDFNPDTSSKVEALLAILTASHKKNPTTKTVIFSQWTSFLTIIGTALTAHSLPFTRIDGTLSPPARDAALTTFEKTSPHTPILLASLAVCSVGLNLVAANQVILADSWWAPAIEDQAVDRVHRLGQTRETTVWRLVMDGSVEESVLEIQGEKRRLMAMAFMEGGKEADGGGRGRGREARLGDITKLLK